MFNTIFCAVPAFIARLFCGHVAPTESAGILVGLNCGAQGLLAAGHHKLHHVWVSVEGGRAFSGIQRGNAAAGPSPNVNQAPAALQGCCD
jgi:hypothetical protein